MQDLTPMQERAIELLVRGFTDREVAEMLGVSRTTVTMWKRNKRFRETLDQREAEVFGPSFSGVKELVPLAVDVLQKALKKGNTKVALEIVKMSGAFLWLRKNLRSEDKSEKKPSFFECIELLQEYESLPKDAVEERRAIKERLAELGISLSEEPASETDLPGHEAPGPGTAEAP